MICTPSHAETSPPLRQTIIDAALRASPASLILLSSAEDRRRIAEAQASAVSAFRDINTKGVSDSEERVDGGDDGLSAGRYPSQQSKDGDDDPSAALEEDDDWGGEKHVDVAAILASNELGYDVQAARKQREVAAWVRNTTAHTPP